MFLISRDFQVMHDRCRLQENPEHIAWTNMDAEDQHRVNTVFANVGKALAAYQQTLNRIDAPFDQYVRALEDGDPNAEEILGRMPPKGWNYSSVRPTVFCAIAVSLHESSIS